MFALGKTIFLLWTGNHAKYLGNLIKNSFNVKEKSYTVKAVIICCTDRGKNEINKVFSY